MGGMRRTILALCLALALAGCGDSHKTTAQPSPSHGTDDALRYSQCMRENGVPDWPDPKINANGGVSIDAPEGADPAKVQAAMEKCRPLMPGGEPQKIDPDKLEEARRFSKCVRDSGVPNYPDPDEYGRLMLDEKTLGMAPDSPAVKAAEEKCHALQGGGGSTNDSGGRK
jgi:hypothetical protein